MIWITGASGMLGRHISEKCSVAGISHISTDLDIDISDPSIVSDFINRNTFSWIINCSAYTAVDLAEDEKDKAFAVNAIGVRNIAAAAKSKGAKLIHFSTDYVFPGLKENGYDENDETGPSSVYGASKLAGEYEIISLYDKHFIFRISWLYGPYGKNFVHTMLNLFEQRDELNVVNDQYGSPTYTGELADFIVQLIQSGSAAYGIYNFSGEGMTNWYEFALEIYKQALKYGITGKILKINPVGSSTYPQKAKRPAYSYMLKDKLVNTFSYNPMNWRITLEEYIKSCK
jgi:dTDP-4-dehydrorhamnose reductase